MIATRYANLLEHLGSTRTISDLHGLPEDGIGLRHDVDHDLGVALDMALFERARGIRATYFILHTHPYCEQDHFIDRLRAISDAGHEIGLHLDAIGAWWRGETDDPEGDLARWVDRLRAEGIELVASAAHGAKSCYQGGFANHWIWSELRGEDPASSMDGISAEGIRVEDPSYQISYPGGHRVTRPDGVEFPLWSCSMESLGLRYEACTVRVDRYWSDSGGSWSRSPDPMEHDLSRGRHQVLVHPWWWREPPRSRLLLSTAAGGGEWICDRFASRTSATALHDSTLNQEGPSIRRSIGLKRTEGDLVGLLEDPGRIRTLVTRALAGQRASRRDVVEANVHLAHVDQDLLRGDEIEIVHLHRDPATVVRSILQQGWYEMIDDRSHPRFDTPGWEGFDRIQKACTYWAETNRGLLEQHPDARRLDVESLHGDPKVLEAFIVDLGFELHPVDAKGDAGIDDQGIGWTVPPVSDWNDRDRQVFIDTCGPIATLLGRTLSIEPVNPRLEPGDRPDHSSMSTGMSFPLRKGRTHLCSWKRGGGGPRIVGVPGAGAWFGLARRGGWQGRRPRSTSLVGMDIQGEFDGTVDDPSFVGGLLAIGVDGAGEVVERRPLIRLEPNSGGRLGGRFSIRFTNPAVVDAYPLVVVDQVASNWALEGMSLEWRFQPRTITKVAVRDRDPLETNGSDEARDRKAPLPVLDPDLVDGQRAKHQRRSLFVPGDYEFLLSDYADLERMTLAEYTRIPDVGDRRITIIRHDVDHDLETAVGMAQWEADHGIRSTYCLLHTAWYWGEFDGRGYRHTRELVAAGDRLLELGHEINFHNNLATLALETGCDPGRVLESELDFMRSRGWPVVGTSTHGDRLCGNLGFRNFEIFDHAVKDDFGGPRIVWHEGNAVRLGSLRQEDFGLEYEAYDIHRDVYLSDSGGRLRCRRSAPGRRPFGRRDLDRGCVVGMLTHPIWWSFPPDPHRGHGDRE